MRFFFSFALLLGLAVSGTGQADPIVKMKFEKQTQTNWCWAATATSAINHMRKRAGLEQNVRQCRVVTNYNNVSNDAAYCCDSAKASGTKCNQPGSMYEPFKKHGYLSKQESGQLTDDRFDRMIKELGKDHPVPGAVRWSGQKVGHAILVYGLGFPGFAGGQAIYIYDPTSGKQASMQNKNALNNYGANMNGSWKAMYTLKD